MPKIVYLDTLPAQNGIDILESQSLIEVVKITSNGSYQEAFEELSNAHAYRSVRLEMKFQKSFR